MSDALVESKYRYRLSAICLQNFMAFENTGWVELRPITLLFGRNSSGKSALIRALLLLKQSLESRDVDAPLIFSSKWVDLGSYHNAVHQHDLNRDITFGFRVSRPKFEEPVPADAASEEEKSAYQARLRAYEDGKAGWVRASNSPMPVVDVEESRVELCLTFGLVNEKRPPALKSLTIHGYRIVESKEEIKTIFGMTRQSDGSWEQKSDIPLDYEIEEGEGEDRKTVVHKQFSHEFWKDLVPDMRNGCVPHRLWLPTADRLLQSDRPPDWAVVDTALEFFWGHVTQVIGGLSYLPPLRDEPRRYYRADHGWVRELRKTDSEKRAQVNQWLSNAAINAEVYAKSLDDDDKEGIVAVYLREGSTLHTNLRDVGSGVSQVLPVIVESLQAPEGGLIIVEQPELHLHPSAQAELADVFVALGKRGSLCILETHSASIINRIRRRVAGKELPTANLSVLFVERAAESSKCNLILLKDDGEYDCEMKWLQKFFGTDTNEFTLLKTAGISKEEGDDIERLRDRLLNYESLFDGESVSTMFAILGMHPTSATRMMRVWGEYVCKSIARDKSIQFKDDGELSHVTNRLLEERVFDVNIKRQADAIRSLGNLDSHTSSFGIHTLSVAQACDSLKCLVNLLDQLKAKGLI
jgi:predicted ATPase